MATRGSLTSQTDNGAHRTKSRVHQLLVTPEAELCQLDSLAHAPFENLGSGAALTQEQRLDCNASQRTQVPNDIRPDEPGELLDQARGSPCGTKGWTRQHSTTCSRGAQAHRIDTERSSARRVKDSNRSAKHLHGEQPRIIDLRHPSPQLAPAIPRPLLTPRPRPRDRPHSHSHSHSPPHHY